MSIQNTYINIYPYKMGHHMDCPNPIVLCSLSDALIASIHCLPCLLVAHVAHATRATSCIPFWAAFWLQFAVCSCSCSWFALNAKRDVLWQVFQWVFLFSRHLVLWDSTTQTSVQRSDCLRGTGRQPPASCTHHPPQSGTTPYYRSHVCFQPNNPRLECSTLHNNPVGSS
mmetsp:Transcript_116066/g.201910  ORF Transcript_116066/g.201910 Transcript_116066/m.201910 type:complete len:170 (-) Transcript_116066:161-670(-)